MKHYNRPEWRAFRAEVIRIHDGVCNRCQRGPDDGVTLQVHHNIYLPKRLPWQYPHEACEALCKGCHAEEHGKVMPQSGWEHFGDYVDLGGPDGECELCGTPIRYVFPVNHSKWGTMEVGEVCCEHLTSDDYAANQIRHLKRRTRFVSSSRWCAGKPGNVSITQKGVLLSIVLDGTNYGLRMNGTLGKLRFGSIIEAKVKAFDLIESGVAHKYLSEMKLRADHNRRNTRELTMRRVLNTPALARHATVTFSPQGAFAPEVRTGQQGDRIPTSNRPSRLR